MGLADERWTIFDPLIPEDECREQRTNMIASHQRNRRKLRTVAIVFMRYNDLST